ncbi:MAG TPA: ROK family protein [Acidimicrobiales bacterium]|nr:ROK family protein [Acidimicrobiales bacterium]
MATLAIDIGGTKLAAGVVDAVGSLAHRAQRATAAIGDGEALFADLIGLIDGVLHDARAAGIDIEACGVGCGGPMTAGGAEVSPLNIPAWRRFPLRARLAEHLDLGVAVDNDAKALALGEGWCGAAAGERDFLAMVVSTGVGGGIVSRGRLLEGASGNAGHVGHVFVADGTEAWPRHPAGLLESEASGTAIAQRTGAPAADAGVDVRARTGTLVGRAVASVANLLDLRLAVVAGSVALGYGEPFFAAAQAEVDRLCHLDFSAGTRVIPAGLGDAGPLIGAAAVSLRARGVDIGIV